MLGDIVRRREPALAARRLLSRSRHASALDGLDPYDTFEFLMTASEGIGLKSSSFFLPGGPSPVDITNDLRSKPAQRLFRLIQARGHEIGLHGSAAAISEPTLIREQFADLRATVGPSIQGKVGWGGRQHYLAWRSPETWRAWAHAGLSYDSSYAFPERVGFRAGTCRAFPVFDLQERQQLELEERPLIVQDGTLLHFMGMTGRKGLEHVQQLSVRCRESAGTLTLLWHNSSFTSRHSRGWYLEMLAEVRP